MKFFIDEENFLKFEIDDHNYISFDSKNTDVINYDEMIVFYNILVNNNKTYKTIYLFNNEFNNNGFFITYEKDNHCYFSNYNELDENNKSYSSIKIKLDNNQLKIALGQFLREQNLL